MRWASFPRVAAINAQCLSPAKQGTALGGDTDALKPAVIDTTQFLTCANRELNPGSRDPCCFRGREQYEQFKNPAIVRKIHAGGQLCQIGVSGSDAWVCSRRSFEHDEQNFQILPQTKHRGRSAPQPVKPSCKYSRNSSVLRAVTHTPSMSTYPQKRRMPW